MQYYLQSVGFWDHILLANKNPKLVAIVLEDKDIKDDAKFKHQEKHTNKIITWTKNNVKCKTYLNHIYLSYIQ